jgi:hypothetical protein
MRKGTDQLLTRTDQLRYPDGVFQSLPQPPGDHPTYCRRPFMGAKNLECEVAHSLILSKSQGVELHDREYKNLQGTVLTDTCNL